MTAFMKLLNAASTMGVMFFAGLLSTVNQIDPLSPSSYIFKITLNIESTL